MRAPRRTLNPRLWHLVERSGKQKAAIASVAGFPFYTSFYEALHAETIPATPRMIERLERLADAVGFPRAELFLDEATR